MGRAEPFAMQSSRSAGTCSRFDGLHQVDKLLARMDVAFGVDVLQVRFHRALADYELLCNVGGASSDDIEIEHIAFASSQAHAVAE